MKLSLVFPDNETRVKSLVHAMERVWREEGTEVSPLGLVNVPDEGGGAFSCIKRSDLIVIGSATVGWSGGISPVVEDFLHSRNLVEGRRVAVFVSARILGSSGALKKIMSLVEECGGFLFDFEVIGNTREAAAFARRLLGARQTDNSDNPS